MTKTKTVVIPLALHDFDPSEVAIPWQQMRSQGITVKFATECGNQASADPLMLTGEGLDFWGFIPGLKKIRLFGLMLRAESAARQAYQHMLQDAEFQQPLKFSDLKVEDFDGVWLPGGHAPKMRDYLEDQDLRKFIVNYFETPHFDHSHKPVAAVCHGVLVCSRAISAKTGHSVLYGKKTTSLTWKLESTAWMLTKYFLRFWDPNYYRTYQESPGEPKGYWSVEAEVKRALAKDEDYLDVGKDAPHYWLKSSGMARDSLDNDKPAWVVQDGNYLSGRWPGDVYTLTKRFIGLL